jgi:hypothetical protein
VKKLLIFVILLISANVYSQTPTYLKGGEIEIKLQDGSVYKFKSSEFKIVPRKKIKKDNKVKTADTSFDFSKQSIKIFAGVGPDGFTTTKKGSDIFVDDKKRLILGFGYEKRLTEKWGVEGVLLSNETGLLGASYYFK